MTAKQIEKPLDMAAVGRVSRRVSLDSLLLVGIEAERLPSNEPDGVLEPDVEQAHRLVSDANKQIQVEANVTFTVSQGKARVLNAKVKYLLFYSVQGDEAIATDDAKQFARANGAYHTWPFVRETLFGLTAKMGLPPFLLPVLSFQAPEKKEPSSERPLQSTELVKKVRHHKTGLRKAAKPGSRR